MSDDTEELRLTIAHLKMALRHAATFTQGILRTDSPDVDSWREDVQALSDQLERDLVA
jgi:hypothetical protein